MDTVDNVKEKVGGMATQAWEKLGGTAAEEEKDKKDRK